MIKLQVSEKQDWGNLKIEAPYIAIGIRHRIESDASVEIKMINI